MTNVHVEGAGMLGCLLMLELSKRQIDFTWSDIETPYNAWQASTGCIYPTSNHEEMKAYEWWARETSGYLPIRMNLEVGDYWFNTKQPPHGYKYPIDEVCGHGDNVLRRAGYTYHLNVQNFVLDVRRAFKAQRTEPDPNAAACYVVAHARSGPYLWGWHVKAEVGFPFQRHPVRRPCVSLRVNRFQTAYAYPSPGTALWYVGSSMVQQTTPKRLDAMYHFRRVQSLLAQFGVTVKATSSFSQGWRPKPTNGTEVIVEGQQIYLPSMAGNGVRLAPTVINQALRAIMERL